MLVQYPFYGYESEKFYNLLLTKLPSLKIKNKIIVIHDLEAIHKDHKAHISWEDEKNFIESFDNFVVHNSSMAKLFQDQISSAKIHLLNIFDYRIDVRFNVSESIASRNLNEVFFAGNLAKAEFLKDIDKVNSFNFHVYGPNFNTNYKFENLHYHGVLNSNEIILEGANYGFGLVWDRNSIDGLSGHMGNYMTINSPYKLSSNIVSGLPIITSKKSGIAEFIKENKLGILVDSLEELNTIKVNHDDYNEMIKNVLFWREKIITGSNSKNLLKNII